MPIYTYTSEDGESVDRIYSMSERPDTISLNGKVYSRSKVYSIARNTEINRYGVNGVYDPDLQTRYSSYKERDAILESRDLTIFSKKEVEASVSKVKSDFDKTTKRLDAHAKAIDAQKTGKASYMRAYRKELNT